MPGGALLLLTFVAFGLSVLASCSVPSPCQPGDPQVVCDWRLSKGRY